MRRPQHLSRSRSAALVALLAVAGFAAVWGSYGFRYLPSDSAGWAYALHAYPPIRDRLPSLARVIGWIDTHHLVPNVYSEGFLLSQVKAQSRNAFLAGDYGDRGWWYYFPVAFAIKTPVVLLLAAAAGLVVWGWRSRDKAMFVLVPIVVYLGWSMTTHINIGVRHILPIYPFVIVLAAAALAFVGCAAETAIAYPHQLAFFNLLVGGPSHGSEYLVDSNLDWGQDLKPLKRWMDDHQISHINLAYFGSADPRYYGIDCTFLPGAPTWVNPEFVNDPRLPGYVAVSATLLRGVYAENDQQRQFYAPLARMTPAAVIGHSIFVYWVERPWH
jgi:hypothetical protein